MAISLFRHYLRGKHSQTIWNGQTVRFVAASANALKKPTVRREITHVNLELEKQQKKTSPDHSLLEFQYTPIKPIQNVSRTPPTSSSSIFERELEKKINNESKSFIKLLNASLNQYHPTEGTLFDFESNLDVSAEKEKEILANAPLIDRMSADLKKEFKELAATHRFADSFTYRQYFEYLGAKYAGIVEIPRLSPESEIQIQAKAESFKNNFLQEQGKTLADLSLDENKALRVELLKYVDSLIASDPAFETSRRGKGLISVDDLKAYITGEASEDASQDLSAWDDDSKTIKSHLTECELDGITSYGTGDKVLTPYFSNTLELVTFIETELKNSSVKKQDKMVQDYIKFAASLKSIPVFQPARTQSVSPEKIRKIEEEIKEDAEAVAEYFKRNPYAP